MAITCVGFDGTYNETALRMTSHFFGSRFAAEGWIPSRVTGVDRTLRLGTGMVHGHGVTATNTAPIDVQLATLGAGNTSRWDLIVLRLNWTANTATPTIIQGIPNLSGPTIPAGAKTADSDRDAGEADIPLALAQAVNTSSDLMAVYSMLSRPQKVVFWDENNFDPPASWFNAGTLLQRDRPNGTTEQRLKRVDGSWQSLTHPPYQNLTMLNGHEQASRTFGTTQTPRARIHNGMVQVRGAIQKNVVGSKIVTNSIVAKVPDSAMIPAKNAHCLAAGTSQDSQPIVARYEVYPVTGEIKIWLESGGAREWTSMQFEYDPGE